MSPRLSPHVAGCTSTSIYPRLSLLLHSERYRLLDAKPAIRSRTDFFAAASIVTRVLAYGGATTFMAALSDELERVNASRAQLICRGLLYVTGSVERNTLDFVRYEQVLVQQALDRLRGSDPHGYSEQIRLANAAIAGVLKRRRARTSSAVATFVRATESCLTRLGRKIEFAAQSDREALGWELACTARTVEHAGAASRGAGISRLPI